VKIGTGGFEILYLKKQKTWRIAYGGRVGMNKYYFFKSPDGYWYNSMFSGKIEYINSHGGLIPVLTANPLMRGQYTSLEKQIDSLHADKKSFMDKYGTWVLAISFVLIAGFMLYLCYKEFATAMASLNSSIKLEGDILTGLAKLAGNLQALNNTGGSALIPALALFGLFKKKKKKIDPVKDIPQDVLDDFNLAEKTMINSGGEAKPYKILFDISQKNKMQRAVRREIENGKTATEDRIISRPNQGIDSSEPILQGNSRVEPRRSIQASVNRSNEQTNSGNGKPNTDVKRRFGGFRFRKPARRVSDY
jgi:hypothetical protein